MEELDVIPDSQPDDPQAAQFVKVWSISTTSAPRQADGSIDTDVVITQCGTHFLAAKGTFGWLKDVVPLGGQQDSWGNALEGERAVLAAWDDDDSALCAMDDVVQYLQHARNNNLIQGVTNMFKKRISSCRSAAASLPVLSERLQQLQKFASQQPTRLAPEYLPQRSATDECRNDPGLLEQLQKQRLSVQTADIAALTADVATSKPRTSLAFRRRLTVCLTCQMPVLRRRLAGQPRV